MLKSAMASARNASILAVVAAAIAVSAASCFGDPGATGAVGVRGSIDDVVIRVQPCDQAQTVVKAILRPAGSGKQAIWEIDATGNSSTRAFVVGMTPNGFVERTHLAEPLAPNASYVAEVTLSNQLLRPNVRFSSTQLKTNDWRTDTHGYLSDSQFSSLNACN